MNRSVVAGVNGSPESLAAAEWAAGEAARRRARLWLLYAEESLSEGARMALLPEIDAPRRRARGALREVRRTIAERHRDLIVEAHEITQDPRDALQAASKEAEVVVLGSSGMGAVAGYLMGSVGLATVAHAHCPVVLVRAGESAREAGAAVVLGIDVRTSCDPVIDFAFDAASRRAAPLHVVYAWKLPEWYGYAPGLPPQGELPNPAEESMRALASTLAPWRTKWPSVQVTEAVVTGRAGHEVVQAAQDAALLVVGRRVRHPSVGAAVGAVAHAVLHHARCPVGVVPHE
ncbi:universal stress protein [Streptomyces sp. ODS28]|uniref:universal stress protein n=1 Tax=Streptomyces sp. ODS28 TaxID=3136688 RepID=UPI0031EDEC58